MTRKQALAIVIGLTLLGFALRLYRIEAVPYRGDEAFTVLNWVSRPLLETLGSEIPLADPQPPLAFALFRGWSLIFGTGEFQMRLLPALLNLLGVPALYALGHRLSGRTLGVLAAALWAIHPFLIWHSQDTKAYAVWVAVSAMALWLALRALHRQHRLDWLLYILAAATAAYLYYLELFAVLAFNVYVLVYYWRNRPVLVRWILSQVAVGLLLAPWYIQERLLFSSGYSGTTYPFDPARILTWLIPSLSFGEQDRMLSAGMMAAIWPFVLIILLLGLVAWWRTNHRYALLLAMVGFLPVLLLSLVSLRLNVFTPRYILSVVPAYILLVAALILFTARSIRQPALRRLLPVMLGAGWMLISGLSLYNYYFEPAYAKAPDWRALVSYLHTRASADDLVVQAAADEAFTLYFDQFSASERLPANPRQPVSEIIGRLQTGEDTYRSIWLVARTPDDWPNAAVAPDWLESNMQQVRQASIGALQLPVRQFLPWQVTPEETERTPLAAFGNTAELIGVQIWIEAPSDHLLVWVYWRPLDITEQPLKVFVHLAGPANPATGTPLWAQDDHFPQHERISTTSWVPGEVYRDVYQLPLAGVPAGEYDLLVGLYNPETGERLPVSVSEGDSYRIGTITLPTR